MIYCVNFAKSKNGLIYSLETECYFAAKKKKVSNEDIEDLN